MNKVEILNKNGKICKFDYDKAANKLTMSFAGFLVAGDGVGEFLNEYGRITSSLIKENTTLILDVKELKPFQQEFLDNLGELYKDYATFKKVYSVSSTSAITNLQTKRLLDKLGITDKFTFVDSIEDIK